MLNIKYEPRNKVANIIIERPEKKNAFTSEMYLALAQNLKKADSDKGVHVILISGNEKFFSSGNDITDFLENKPENNNSPVMKFMKQILATQKPVIAKVNGMAIGIGATLLLNCDLVYVSESTIFSFPFVNLGLCPEFATTYIFSRLAGHQIASEKLLLGEPFKSTEALNYGLVNKVLPENQLDVYVDEKINKLISLPLESLLVTKKLLKKNSNKIIHQTLENEFEYFVKMMKSENSKEAFSAFLEKRKPIFN